MVGRNIVVGGMSGGAGHVGMVTQGYGGTYVEPAIIVMGEVILRMPTRDAILDMADRNQILNLGGREA